MINNKNKTQQLGSLADELDFYDHADDEDNTKFEHHTGIFDEDNYHDDEELKKEIHHLKPTDKEIHDLEPVEEQKEEIQETLSDNFSNEVKMRKNTGTSSDIENYMLCQG